MASMSSSFGIAVISLDFPSTARCRSANPASVAKPNQISAPAPSGQAFEPRKVLPSTATTSGVEVRAPTPPKPQSRD